MELQFEVNEELCIGCGECSKDCPFQLIEMKDDVPTMAKENEANCLQCQHCLAVCSTGALSILGKNPADSIPLPGSAIPAKQLATLMQSRRSVRRYKKDRVSPEDIAFLLETVGYAPTGINNQQVLLTVIDDPQIMDSLRKKVYTILAKLCESGSFPAGMEYLQGYVQDALVTGQDTLFRGAPHLLIASSPKAGPCPEADCFIALTYFELLAASMGMGALWSGLAKWTLTGITPEILAGLGVPDSHQVGYIMVFGRPDVTYRRTVQRDHAHINRVQQIV